jgi:hypothetical protein
MHGFESLHFLASSRDNLATQGRAAVLGGASRDSDVPSSRFRGVCPPPHSPDKKSANSLWERGGHARFVRRRARSSAAKQATKRLK